MPSLTTWAPFCTVVLPMWTTLSPVWYGCSCQGCKPTNYTGTLRNLPNPASGTYTNTRRNSSEPSGIFRTLPPEPTPTRAGTLQNPLEPSETFRNQPFRTFRNLPPEPTPSYNGTLRNLPEYTILHQNSPEPSGTFRNPPPEPTPAHAGTLRNLPEPSPGTCSCDPHRHTPELFWAEDPISSRCWGINKILKKYIYTYLNNIK